MNETKYRNISLICENCCVFITKKHAHMKSHQESKCKSKLFNDEKIFKSIISSVLPIFNIESESIINIIMSQLKQTSENSNENDEIIINENEQIIQEPLKTIGVIEDDKSKFKRVNKNYINNVVEEEESAEDKQKHIEEVQKIIDNRRKECKSITDAFPIFEKCFEKLKDCKIDATNNKTLELIKNTRMDLLKITPYNEYKKIIEEHVKRLSKIFKDKEFNERKINSNIFKSLNSIDTRIILWQSYYTIALEYDHIQNFSSCLDFSVVFPEEYEPFNYDSFFKQFHNYGSVIFSIRDLINKYIFNSYGSFNFIYLQLKSSADDDPFSFYRLNKILDDGTILWVMDCRAETLSNNFISDLKPYLIMMFRKIYYDIFHDNNYRPNFSSEAVIAETDCEQLIKNILVLSNPIECCNLFRTLIKENATHKQTKKDKWNMYADDDFQKKRFKKNVKPDILDIIKPLFDDISSEQAVDFYREKN